MCDDETLGVHTGRQSTLRGRTAPVMTNLMTHAEATQKAFKRELCWSLEIARPNLLKFERALSFGANVRPSIDLVYVLNLVLSPNRF